MKRLFAVILVIASLALSGTMARANTAEEKMDVLKSIISSSVESNDYLRITEVLSSLNDVDLLQFSNADITFLKAELMRAISKAESSVDPVVTGALVDEAARLFPDDKALSVKLLRSYLELGQSKEATDLYIDILTKYGVKDAGPELEAAGYAYKGSTMILARQYNDARKELEMAIDRDPKWTGPYFLMSALEIRTKDYDAAESYLKMCLELNPNHGGAKKVLEEILPLKKAGRAEEAPKEEVKAQEPTEAPQATTVEEPKKEEPTKKEEPKQEAAPQE